MGNGSGRHGSNMTVLQNFMIPTSGDAPPPAPIELPPGIFMDFASGVIPIGWLACDGASYAVATHPELWAEIGDTWGGDGGTNFNVPETRGEFIRAFDDGRGVDAGRAMASFQDHMMLAHTHHLTFANSSGAGTILGLGSVNQDANVPVTTTGGTENRPRNMPVTVGIKT